MDTHSFDVIVVGAGIAGAAAGAGLAPTHRVALVEAERSAGYHTTGRSAAMWILNYGPPDVRVLTGLSRPFFEHPPAGFADVPLMRRRPKVFLGPPGAGSAVAVIAGGRRGPAPRRDRRCACDDTRATAGLRGSGGDRGRCLRYGRCRGSPRIPAANPRAWRRAGARSAHPTHRAKGWSVAGLDRRGRDLSRARRRQCGGGVGGRGGAAGGTPAPRAYAVPPDRRHHRPGALGGAGLAARGRCRPDLVRAAGGADPAHGDALRRDPDAAARCPA